MKTIEEIKKEITELGNVLPGVLTEQRNKCGKSNCHCATGGERHGPYWQLSWMKDKKSYTKYVKPDNVPEVRERIKNYIKLQSLISELLILSVQIEMTPPKKDKDKKTESVVELVESETSLTTKV
jgi:hypothetical protein